MVSIIRMFLKSMDRNDIIIYISNSSQLFKSCKSVILVMNNLCAIFLLLSLLPITFDTFEMQFICYKIMVFFLNFLETLSLGSSVLVISSIFYDKTLETQLQWTSILHKDFLIVVTTSYWVPTNSHNLIYFYLIFTTALKRQTHSVVERRQVIKCFLYYSALHQEIPEKCSFCLELLLKKLTISFNKCFFRDYYVVGSLW